MKVRRTENGLAGELPENLVEELGIKEGDEVEVRLMPSSKIEINKPLTREEAIAGSPRNQQPLAPKASSSTETRRMSVNRVFFDTNMLIYATSAGDPRQQVAMELLLAGGSASVQAFQ